MPRLRVGFLLFPEFAALDLVGPHEVFAAAKAPDCEGYEILTVGLDRKPVRSESGLTMAVNTASDDVEPLDTIVIPGGVGLRNPAVLKRVVPWLVRQEPRTRRIASVCTGLYGLASTGLMDGRRATTHWQFVADVAKRFPAVHVVEDRLFVSDGKFHTSAGVASGIDLSLQLVEDDYGSAAALRVARELVVYLRRSGSQQQFSDVLRLQFDNHAPGSGLVAWIAAHMGEDLSLARVASHLKLSPRQANRVVSEQFGIPPAKLVERVRLDHAKTLLLGQDMPVEQVARASGFGNHDTFRRAFTRGFGVSPREFQARFSGEK
ncbi:MAG: GlxA family transcriptional regulator [Armatimonadetes bacterium]|nr:GlxA family transcriptional regulator [Armatimonadota bacterium]